VRQETRPRASAQRGTNTRSPLCAPGWRARAAAAIFTAVFAAAASFTNSSLFLIGLRGGNPPVQPGRFFLVLPAIEADVVNIHPVLRRVVLILVVVRPGRPLLVVVVQSSSSSFRVLVIGFGPAFRLSSPLEVHLVPGLQVEFLDSPSRTRSL